jgi:hypothetical protein
MRPDAKALKHGEEFPRDLTTIRKNNGEKRPISSVSVYFILEELLKWKARYRHCTSHDGHQYIDDISPSIALFNNQFCTIPYS